MTISATATRRRLEAEIPPFRRVAIQLLRMAGDPSTSFAEISDLLRTDSVLTAELLRVANSPLFRRRQEIASALHAIAFLGLDLVRSLAVTASLRGLTGRRSGHLAETCWRHGLATALVCKCWSGSMGLEEERCYTAGLIHDIGQIALAHVFKEYESVISAALGRGERVPEAEERAFGMSHFEAGRWLLSRWECPLELQNVAALHGNPPATPSSEGDLVRLVLAGSRFADMIHLSVFPGLSETNPQRIVSIFPETQRRTLEESFPELAEWVLVGVNGVEGSFV
jgi:HD-like signal output (HDOD) protein